MWTRVRGREIHITGIYMTSCAKLKQFGHAQIMDNGHIGGGRAEAGGPERRFMVVVKEDINSQMM